MKGWERGCPGMGERMLGTVKGDVQGWERETPQNGIRECPGPGRGCGELGKGMPRAGEGDVQAPRPAAG